MTTPGPFYAHTLDSQPPSKWQDLQDHLEGTAAKAAAFADVFGAAEWGRLTGLWHDLGKYSNAFQQYLRNVGSPDSHQADSVPKTDHSTAGAQHAVATLEVPGHLLAYVIAGHHCGLLDGRRDTACLESRLRKEIEPWPDAPDSILHQSTPEFPNFLGDAFGSKDAFPISFFTRMLMSCLVDADFLDTEAFMSPDRAAERPNWPEKILHRLQESLDSHMASLPTPSSGVNRERARVRASCLDAAQLTPGLFSLTVPTGGGKTLSSLAFALRHAISHGLRRIVYVIPFTSIIEQNANVFREVFRSSRMVDVADPVLEHHSNLDIGRETVRTRPATENWDAPLIVTTSVQFYESLFASRTSRVRKLHNLAGAVIILDEAQTIPVQYLKPCLKAIRELARNYGSSVVLCTATQPAIHRRQDFDIGLDGVREIIDDPPRLYKCLKRVEVKDVGRLVDEELSERMLEGSRILTIVNTRRHARAVFELLGEDEAHFHLSALMCPSHRTDVLARIRRRLDAGLACRVVSTQLVEAGVDLDFPVVYRSLAGLDSIAQAAGRCNRNGLDRVGQTFVFRSEHESSERFFRETADVSRQLLPLHDDPLSLGAIEHYFKLYYWDQSTRWDFKEILGEFRLDNDRNLPFLFGFATAAERFRVIEDNGRPVIVPWGADGAKLCDELRKPWAVPTRRLLQALQRFSVRVPQRLWVAESGALEMVHERYAVLANCERHYSDSVGLMLEGSSTAPLIG